MILFQAKGGQQREVHILSLGCSGRSRVSIHHCTSMGRGWRGCSGLNSRAHTHFRGPLMDDKHRSAGRERHKDGCTSGERSGRGSCGGGSLCHSTTALLRVSSLTHSAEDQSLRRVMTSTFSPAEDAPHPTAALQKTH